MIPSYTLPARAPAAPVGEAERHWRGGLEHARAGRWKEAEKAYARAVRGAPRESLYRVNLAQARRRLGDLEGAAAAVDEALAVAPNDALAGQMRVAIDLERHRYGAAVDAALALVARPDATHAHWFDCGEALYRAGRWHDAISALLQALARKPDAFEAYVTLCNAFDRIGMHAEAVECLRTASALRPGWGPALAGVVYHALYACDWSRLEEDTAALRELLARPGDHGVAPFLLLCAGVDAVTQRRAGESFSRALFGAVPRLAPRAPHELPAGPRLRVGYLSADFQQHATAMLLAEVLERHDRGRFEIRLYSTGLDDGSAWRARLREAGDAFVDLTGLSDAEAARRIRDDGVELLVDLKGHTLHARTGIVAMRPAPVSAAWLGFPASTGADFVDYAIVDPVVAPPDAAGEFTESLARMPHCYQPNDRLRPVAQTPTREACGLPGTGVVLCCFNHTYKIRPETFSIWCRLLDAVPGSVLWLLESNAQARANLLREAAARGVDAGRLVFAPLRPPAEHLARLVHADLFLDTTPVNAHTTASDALWMGVPVLTTRGDAFVGRVAASLLHAVGLPELAVPDAAAYEATALALARDPVRIAALKARLLEARERAPLWDATGFARDLEALYERMIGRWRAGEPPAALPATPRG